MGKATQSKMEKSDQPRLRQICLLASDTKKAVSALEADSSTRAEEKRQLGAQLLRQYPQEAWPKETYRYACPHPILVHPQHVENLRNLHQALVLAVVNIVERWWTDTAANFPARMPLEPHEEDLLRVSYLN